MPLSVKDCVAKFDEKKVERKNWTGHSAKVHSVAWNKDGTRLASGSADKTTRVWEVTNDSKYSSGNSQQLTGHTGPVDQLCWDPTGTTQLASASSDKTVRVWDLRQSATPCVTVSTVGENINIAWAQASTVHLEPVVGDIFDVSLKKSAGSPDGNYIAVGNKEDVLTMIDARKFKAIRVQRFNHEVNEFAWDNSGKYLFMTTELGTVEICSHELKRIKAIQAHPSNIYCIEFDKSNRYFAVGSADAIVSLFTLPEMICVRTFTKLEYAVRTISFSHDSSMLTSASEEPLIDISHVQTGDSVHQLDGNAPINAVAWSPRDHILAYAGDEKDRYNDAGNVRLLRCAA